MSMIVEQMGIDCVICYGGTICQVSRK